jgi:tripartite-type tricarboxylate transporter receptor subunit TctC
MKHTMGLLAGCSILLTVPAALAQAPYPSQPIRFIVTTAPGGGLDNFGRLVARELIARAGQQVIVDNRPGAGTTIGSTAVARSKPDGYTVLVNTSALAISPAIYDKLPYDTLRDLEPVTMGAAAPNLLVVHPSLPVKSVKELLTLAKTRAIQGEPILYASGGNGTNGHLAAELFINMAQIRLTHVPYKSGSLATVDVIAGQVPVFIDTVSSVRPHVSSGKLRAIAVSSARRSTAAPGIPTFIESGVPGYESAQWYGLLVPAGTPPDIIAWLHREVTALLRATAVKDRLAAEGMEVVANSPDEFATMIRADIAKWTRLVKAIGLSPS